MTMKYFLIIFSLLITVSSYSQHSQICGLYEYKYPYSNKSNENQYIKI